MMMPMPFCPSFDPCAKETPIDVSSRKPRMRAGGGLSSAGGARLVADLEGFCQAHQPIAEREPDQWRDQQRQDRAFELQQIDPMRGRIMWQDQRGSDANPHDRSDQRVTGRNWKAKPPGRQIPDDRRNQEGKDHRSRPRSNGYPSDPAATD